MNRIYDTKYKMRDRNVCTIRTTNWRHCNTSFSDTFRYIINYNLLLFIVMFSFRSHGREALHVYWFNEHESSRPLLFFHHCNHCSVELLLFHLSFIHFQTVKKQQWDFVAIISFKTSGIICNEQTQKLGKFQLILGFGVKMEKQWK